jgi:hypothetical protein
MYSQIGGATVGVLRILVGSSVDRKEHGIRPVYSTEMIGLKAISMYGKIPSNAVLKSVI